MIIPLSILDLAPIRPGQSATDSFAASVALAQHAEEWGYRRVWYAEHHNIPTIASSATSVLIAHVAALTRTIRVGAGGIMLPNHAPLTIAEQFGTLEALHPGRIDLGLGRAPGSDQNTMRALRRYEASADSFPEDVLELQGYLGGETRIPGVDATPGKGTHVPLYILGSSMFGANLAALFGLPFAFASHFAPDALQDAVAAYRREFRPSAQLEQPYVIAGVNVIAADTSSAAQEQHLAARRNRVRSRLGRGVTVTDEEADMLLDSPAGQHVQHMFRFAAVGTAAEVSEYIDAFARYADADELIVAHQSPTTEARLRSGRCDPHVLRLGRDPPLIEKDRPPSADMRAGVGRASLGPGFAARILVLAAALGPLPARVRLKVEGPELVHAEDNFGLEPPTNGLKAWRRTFQKASAGCS